MIAVSGMAMIGFTAEIIIKKMCGKNENNCGYQKYDFIGNKYFF